jgi:hypothetical protein
VHTEDVTDRKAQVIGIANQTTINSLFSPASALPPLFSSVHPQCTSPDLKLQVLNDLGAPQENTFEHKQQVENNEPDLLDSLDKNSVIFSSRSSAKPININLCADIANDLPWELKPTISKMKVYPGDTALTFYIAHNLSKDAITGVATYSVSPAKAGLYFNKIQCFCFEEQRLKGKEYVELPILFFIDSDFLMDPKMKDIDSITLSYTFFKI